MIHYVEIFEVIKVRGKWVTSTDEARIICGIESGEADNRKREVTCPKCRELLEPRRTGVEDPR